MTDFDHWLDEAIAKVGGGGFTAVIVLVAVDADGIRPVASSYVHVGAEGARWVEMLALLAGAGCVWQAAVFFPLRAGETGGAVADDIAREHRAACEKAILDDPLAINRGFFCDETGQRLIVEAEPG